MYQPQRLQPIPPSLAAAAAVMVFGLLGSVSAPAADRDSDRFGRHVDGNETRRSASLLASADKHAVAFALHAKERLEFGRGISTDDEPDLWLGDLTGDIELWVDPGTPDPDRLRKACGRARGVVLYAYGERSVAAQQARRWL